MDQKIVDSIKSSLDQKKSKEQIYQQLLHDGVTIEQIQEGFAALTLHEQKEDTQKRTINIILIIAAILIGAGIFSFIASNWQAMSNPEKITVIVVSMLLSYGLGWFAKEKRQLQKTGDALILLGVIIYGAGIFLVGQMFHIRANWPDGFILWMLGAIVMAYAVESFALLYLAIPLGIVAIIGHPFDLFQNIFTDRSFLFSSTFLLLIATIITFVTGWFVRKRMPVELQEIH